MSNKDQKKMVPAPDIESHIFTLRGEKVLLDFDLAPIYGVPTGALNRAVKRNRDRFPEDFRFKLTGAEVMRCQTGIASRRNLRYLPYAFTGHGARPAWPPSAKRSCSRARPADEGMMPHTFIELKTRLAHASAIMHVRNLREKYAKAQY
jgi:hypothetical protein